MEKSKKKWIERNNEYLVREIDKLKVMLDQFISKNKPQEKSEALYKQRSILSPDTHDYDDFVPAVESISRIFGLTYFERSVLLLCAGIELDSDLSKLCSLAHGDHRICYPTFGLAMAFIPQSHWSAITPVSPLRRCDLIYLISDSIIPITRSPLRIAERVLHYLRGISYVEEEFRFIAKSIDTNDFVITKSHEQIASRILLDLKNRLQTSTSPVINLWGTPESSKMIVAKILCDNLNTGLLNLNPEFVPLKRDDLRNFIHLCIRESHLTNSGFYLSLIDSDENSTTSRLMINEFLENLPGLKFLCTEHPYHNLTNSISYELERFPRNDQLSVLESYIYEGKMQRDMLIDIDYRDIQNATSRMNGLPNISNYDSRLNSLLEMKRDVIREHLSDLAQTIIPKSGFKDIVLPEREMKLLGLITIHAKQREKVYRDWGFENKNSRGLGITALFSGESGTGKTMAAEAIARELDLDLFRIDLSTVINKYVGETPKRIKKIFDSTENGGAVLFFDEADALFGKRSEIRDSHDRYANVEVGYLLQRMEDYKGLAILATNMKNSLDEAFIRRIRFLVNFPFPTQKSREEIWNKVFPPSTPLYNLDLKVLSRLNITGGHIKNIALNAAFLAANEGVPVTMEHIKESARIEYAKMDNQMAQSELTW